MELNSKDLLGLKELGADEISLILETAVSMKKLPLPEAVEPRRQTGSALACQKREWAEPGQNSPVKNERSEAIHDSDSLTVSGLLRRFASRNDGKRLFQNAQFTFMLPVAPTL
ncbi:MAG: hypothetical protein LBL69_05395, partial [Zoogloeaceae bacterium]|jgi:hypothetical protein|nr:hypothetical protein [Zoogloeaceae bacterium]